MQAQLLTSALRRRPEFHITTCPMDTVSILQAVSLGASPGRRSFVESARQHLRNRDDPAPLSSFPSRDSEGSAGRHLRPRTRGQRLPLRRSRHFSITDANLRLLCKCLLRVAAGQIWASTEQLNYIMDLISEVPSLRVLNSRGSRLLTPREEQVVALVAEGLGNREIARELNLSEHTIKKYLFRIFEKLGISTRVELVLYAVNNGDPRQAEWLAGASRILPSA